MQLQIAQRNLSPDAKPGTTGHGLGQAWQVGPYIFVELADNQIAPVAPRPFGWLLLKLRPALATPGTQKRSLFHGAQGDFQEINIKHIVVVHENQQVTLGLAYATQTSL